jgi:hypothetical protein
MTSVPSALSVAEIEHFVQHGFVKLEGALDRAFASRWVARTWQRIGYDPQDASTWREARVHFPITATAPVSEIAPRAYAAICQLCGGAERIRQPVEWTDGFIANYGVGKDGPWAPPSPQLGGWHKDGDSFRHFLDSPEQGLLTIALWDDVHHRGGPTYLACDSIGHIARWLAAHPEGANPEFRHRPELGDPLPTKALIEQCRDFREATGRAGDVYLMHPFMLHTQSANHLGRARFITNAPVHFRAPMRFDRERAEDHSPVELAILRALGVDRFPFAPTRERIGIAPHRLIKERELLAAERARAAAGRGS